MGGPTRRVLVVDDEPQVRSALARVVRQLDYVAVVAASAEEAVALSQDDTFDVVVTDVAMPGMDGLAMLQRLSPVQPNARFVIVTGQSTVEPESLPVGHRCKVIRKPWSGERLAASIRGDDTGTPSTLPPPRPKRSAPTKVLLVEDDSADARHFERALELAHPGEFEVTHARSLSETQQLLGSAHPDVVALDLGLAETSGLQTLARIQAEAPDLGMVVLSGMEDPELALQSVQVGAQDFLVKGKVGGATIGKALRYAEERKRVERRLSELAFHDQLTGLANRMLFRQRIAQAMARSRRSGASFAILLLDLDRFKAVNDALGHDAGDIYLQQVAMRLRRATRETDTVARLGGDEFAILAEPVQSKHDVERLAHRVLTSLRQPLEISGVTLHPTGSIGAAIHPESGNDSDSLLTAADAAMYVVKAEGRNACHIHGAELTKQLARRLDMEARLRHAVDDEAFILHYQPQVALDGNFVGAEALLRWTDEHGTLHTAADFMPILEESGLIVELGQWVVRSACRQLAAWRDSGLHVDRIAVNLSAKQFVRDGLHETIRRASQDFGLEPRDVELELTETTLINDDDAVAPMLQQLDQEGYRLALDDFGTGYSSLAHLHAFPIRTVKIDKTFVRDMAADEFRQNLVGGIIQLALRLGLDVIAEGVEDERQLSLLHEQGCRVVQGHYLALPVSEDQFPQALHRAVSAIPSPLLRRLIPDAGTSSWPESAERTPE